ncbi:hypothetical protein A2803_02780 [Candidatus Woesebacteria bacterium RIFCSPHIGHO2_01_FULL_44_21]|uniref:DUF458 domain-containing protein n=1 Tax=Candidatus Woesebacteria bacterium RIFCSPHIGHO2_01_FULL_44_21 TaxID=1802503 RepID=A0A1F7YXN4_9BACT|nr:MAG: hypothetical protein A2803_02780 [Candidatus Woesebacteria bacterium RIFCSPHIGHO2_01_FULL_44_21]OGM69802.1 MAG: hypothetical protein A2897_00465 [Candidatus Woesebacteria bacterium RIFCSPLOWO2_01_FULL_44_24b]
MKNLNSNGHFVSPSVGALSVPRMISEITNFVKSDPGSYYKLVIGTDSQVRHTNGLAECDYVTAIIIHRLGTGAKYFWKKEKVKIAPVLRDKIYKETTMSLNAAETLVPEIRKSINGSGKYELEIHIDVGKQGPTREMIKEVVGMVTGSGYVAKTKPDSWGASSVADKHT